MFATLCKAVRYAGEIGHGLPTSKKRCVENVKLLSFLPRKDK